MKHEQERHQEKLKPRSTRQRIWWGLLSIILIGLLCLASYEYHLWHSTVNEIHTDNTKGTKLIKQHKPFR